MNYQKLDASLVVALDDVADADLASLVVFIYTDTNLDSGATAMLARLGVSDVSREKNIFTGMLSYHQIDQLSDQPWVKSIRRSQTLHLKYGDFRPVR
ncbi:hypothetical protein Nos7524_3884 [Nostoc sp. PCC 7524]|uniref:hypothetical protein n=1 Tax=Nostoc sp. (strain ATCC 29411 / PCC 7524) TaxID=28072 RepID=UPI00029EF5C1|nr:hypothetical protein [Nostoc sp. PCC 7524]AFY49658.1 hypothetical protein Nos7524_3884 [Nostoc sp. PCC 7524]